MNAALVVVGALLVVQALLYVFGHVKRGWRLGPRLASIVATEEGWRAALRVIAPLQLLGGAAVAYGGVTRSRSDDGPAVLAGVVLTLLGAYLGHRAAVRAAPPSR